MKKITAKELEEKFDSGKDVLKYFDPKATSVEAGRCVRTAYGNERMANLKVSQIIKGRVKREQYRRESKQAYKPYQCAKCGGLWHIAKVNDGRADPEKTASNQKKRSETFAAKAAKKGGALS